MLPASTAVHQYSENFLPYNKQDRQRAFLRDIEARSPNHWCRGKAMSYIFWVRICSLICPARNLHTSYYIICVLPRSTIFFPHYLITSTIFGEKVSEQKYFFRFSLQLLYETCYILRRTERDMVINVKSVFMKNARYSLQILMKLEFFTTGFRKLLKYQISWQSVQWEA